MVDKRLLPRSGFALVSVLWALVGASALALAMSQMARGTIASETNRVAALRSYWLAEACAAELIDKATEFLHAPIDYRDPQRAWRQLDTVALFGDRSYATGRCTVHLESSGARLDLNRASEADFRRLLQGVGLDLATAESLSAALIDWKDLDEITSDYGAEREWYQAAGRSIPRNGPFASASEIRRVRGFNNLAPDQLEEIESLVGVSGHAIDLWHAPRPVLMTLPGFSSTVSDEVIALRHSVAGATGLSQFINLLSPAVRDSAVANYDQLIRRATTTPQNWMLTVRAESGQPSVSVKLELLLGYGGNHVGVLRRRYWLE